MKALQSRPIGGAGGKKRWHWGSDPVHLTPAGYQKVADKLVEKAEAHRMKPPRAAGT